MATFNYFNQFVEDVAAGAHDLTTGTSDVFKVMLVDVVPVATNSVKADIVANEVASGDGYTTGGNSAAVTSGAQTSGTFKLVLADPTTWTATAGTFGTFQWAVLYNDTQTSPADPLIGWWAYASTVDLGAGETFAVDFNATTGVLTLAPAA